MLQARVYAFSNLVGCLGICRRRLNRGRLDRPDGFRGGGDGLGVCGHAVLADLVVGGVEAHANLEQHVACDEAERELLVDLAVARRGWGQARAASAARLTHAAALPARDA